MDPMASIKMSKTDLMVLNAIRDNGVADAIYIDRNVGRVWMAGFVRLNQRSVLKLWKAGVIKQQCTAAAPLYWVLVSA